MATINAREIKSISFDEGSYLTTLDKKAIKVGLSIGVSEFDTPRKQYKITPTDNPDVYKVVASYYDRGKLRRNHVTITVK